MSTAVKAQWNLQKTSDIALFVQKNVKDEYFFIVKELTTECDCAHEYSLCDKCDSADTVMTEEEWKTVFDVYNRTIDKPDIEVD